MKLWLLRSAYNNYEIIVVTASLGVTRRHSLCHCVIVSLCREVLLTAVWLNTASYRIMYFILHTHAHVCV